MFVSAHDILFTRRFARALIALAFLAGTIAPSYAQGLEAASYAGPTAMMGLRIPFGGKGTPTSQPMFGLRFGSSWQARPGSISPQPYRFIPAVEAGLSLRGDPILRLSSFQVRLDQLRAAADGAERESFCGRNLAICILGGVALAGIIIAIAAGSDDCEPSDLYPPGEDPCKCFEADGCK